MKVIDNFIKQYEKEYEFYKQIARIAHNVLEKEIISRGIKSIVSSRAKRSDRLKNKLEKRNQTKNYKSKIAIEKDVTDLAGLRVALYFPSDRKVIEEIVSEAFDIQETKSFPEDSHKPKLNKRFSGYWATHYRVKLKHNDDIDKRFTETIFEIQVASVLMHAWSEVEHDLVYKPFSGKLSDEELSILDEINGLVLSGEIALERLQKAINERTKKQKEITDKYQLTNLILQNYLKTSAKDLNFGNTEYINNFLRASEKLSTADVLNTFNHIDPFNFEESFSDQVLQNLIIISKSENLRKYFSNYTKDKSKISSFELFIKAWILFEKIISKINFEAGIDNKKNFVPSIENITNVLANKEIDIDKLKHLRTFRNQLLHGYQSYTDKELETAYISLIEIIKQTLNYIIDENTRNELRNELNNL